jgi:hypothetical protein
MLTISKLDINPRKLTPRGEPCLLAPAKMPRNISEAINKAVIKLPSITMMNELTQKHHELGGDTMKHNGF